MRPPVSDRGAAQAPRWGQVGLILFVVLAVLLTFGRLIAKHYATDTYVVEAYGNHGSTSLSLGRFLSGWIQDGLTVAGINTASAQSYLTLVAMGLIAGCCFLIDRIVTRLHPPAGARARALVALASVASLCTVLILHWFLFPEFVAFMALALLLAIVAASLAAQPRATAIVAAGMLLILSFGLYQASGAFFVTFGLLFVAVRTAHGSIREFLRGAAVIGGVYVAAGVSSLVLTVALGRSGGRTAFGEADPIGNIAAIVQYVVTKVQATNLGVLPLVAIGLVLAIAAILGATFLWRHPSRDDGSRTNVIVFVTVLAGSAAATVAPHLLTAQVDFSARSIAAVMSLPGVVALLVLTRSRPPIVRSTMSLLAGFLAIVLVANVVVANLLVSARFEGNRRDRETATDVYDEVRRYETGSRTTISTIAVRQDASPTLCHPDLLCHANYRVMGYPGLAVALVSLVADRRFRVESMSDAAHARFFAGRDWSSFSIDQMVFVDDVLYLMLH